MRLAVCQMRSGSDVGANLTEAERLLDEAADAGADLAILPELFPFLGPEARLPEIAEPVPGGAPVEMLGKAAARGQLWIAGGSVPERDGDHLFNTAPLFDRSGELVARYRKIHLFDVDLEGQPPFRESATYRAGTELVTHAMEDLRVGLSICYDLRFPELFRGLMTLGAELFVLPAQFQQQTGVAHWEVLLRARAIENQCFVAAAAQWGEFGSPEEPRRSYGRSMVVGPWGDVLVEAPEEGTGVWFADLDVADLRRVRRVLPALEHRRLGSNC
jgi:deaminated glutathione amidase